MSEGGGPPAGGGVGAPPGGGRPLGPAAAGIGRTTLHKHYATRDDLLRAVGHRSIDRWEQLVTTAAQDGSLLALAGAMVTWSSRPPVAHQLRPVGFFLSRAGDWVASPSCRPCVRRPASPRAND